VIDQLADKQLKIFQICHPFVEEDMIYFLPDVDYFNIQFFSKSTSSYTHYLMLSLTSFDRK